MTRRVYSSWDPDLVAYADRQLDPERAADVARFIEESPEALRCVQEIARQNAALREAFAPQLDEPLPDRLRDLIYDRPAEDSRGLRRRSWIRAAAAVVAVASAGWLGWWIGQEDEPTSLQAFLNEAALSYATGAGAQLSSGLGGEGGGLATVATASTAPQQPLYWLSERISLELDAPDLSHLDLTLMAKRRVNVDGQQGVELVYARPDESRVSLFLKTRWTEEGSEIRTLQARGQAMAYWLDGPLVYAVATPGSGREMEELAQSIHAAIGEHGARKRPALEPVPQQRPAAGEANLPLFESSILPPSSAEEGRPLQNVSGRQAM